MFNNTTDYIFNGSFSMKDLWQLGIVEVYTKELDRTIKIDNKTIDINKKQAKIIPINRNINQSNDNNQSPAA